MITKHEVLEFIAQETRQGHSVSFEDLSEEFGLSLQAACDHLKRLWRDRLIEATSHRPKGFKFRLQPHELFVSLKFRLTPRGAERLRWYRRGSW